MGEAVDAGQLDSFAVTVQPPEPVAGIDGVELWGIAHQQEFGARISGMLDQAGELEGGDHRCFADDDELVLPDLPQGLMD